MKCPICKHGETKLRLMTLTLERDGMAVVFRRFPGKVCDNCGAASHCETVTGALLLKAEEAVTGV